MRRTLNFEVEGQRKKGRLKWTWKKQVEEESMKVGLNRDGLFVIVGINEIATRLR